MLVIDPKTQSTQLVGDLPSGGEKYCGAACDADGNNVYFVPRDASQVLKLEQGSSEADSMTLTMLEQDFTEANEKWEGGCLGRDGRIYCCPFRARRVLQIDPSTDTAKEVGPDLGDIPNYNFGQVSVNGSIWMIHHFHQ